MEKIQVKYKMSLSARAIHTWIISSGWEHLHSIEKYILLSFYFLFHSFNNSPFLTQKYFHSCTILALLQETGFFSEIVFLAPKQLNSITSSHCHPQNVMKSFYMKFHKKSGSIIIIMMNIIIALTSRYSVSIQKCGDRFRDRFCPPKYKHLNITVKDDKGSSSIA